MVRPHFFIIPNNTTKCRFKVLFSSPYGLTKVIVLSSMYNKRKYSMLSYLKPEAIRFHYVFLLLFLTFQSCSLCSQKSVNTSAATDDSEVVHVRQERAAWSTLSEVGLPLISDTIPNILLERYCYTTSYNPKTRLPNWVIWQLTGEHVMKRKKGVWNDFREDMDLPAEMRSTLEDYASSGYDKGHLCPGGDCNWSDEGRDETFLLSNICPQNPNLNRGDWKEIEMACRKWAKQYGSIYIVCGPIFFKSQEHERIGPNQIPVPEVFFKVVLCTESANPKGIGFICRNTDGNRKKDFYVNSIRQVGRVTGYQFFPSLDDSIKNVVFDMDDISEW